MAEGNDGLAKALGQLAEDAREWREAIRYALGADGIDIGTTPALWIAAARCRSPWTDDEFVSRAFPDHDPDAGHAATYSYECLTRDSGHTDLLLSSFPKSVAPHDVNCVTVTLHTQADVGRGLRFELGGSCGRTVGSILWSATIWPQALESFFASAARDLADNVDWWEARWQNKAYLEPLLDADTPFREMGLLTLALGLAAKVLLGLEEADPSRSKRLIESALCQRLTALRTRLLPVATLSSNASGEFTAAHTKA